MLDKFYDKYIPKFRAVEKKYVTKVRAIHAKYGTMTKEEDARLRTFEVFDEEREEHNIDEWVRWATKKYYD